MENTEHRCAKGEYHKEQGNDTKYETAPRQKVVAEVEVLDMLEDSPEQLWLLTREGAGISKEFYDEYFCGREVAFAYKLGSVHIFETPKELSEFGVKVAPQSYIYIK